MNGEGKKKPNNRWLLQGEKKKLTRGGGEPKSTKEESRGGQFSLKSGLRLKKG